MNELLLCSSSIKLLLSIVCAPSSVEVLSDSLIELSTATASNLARLERVLEFRILDAERKRERRLVPMTETNSQSDIVRERQ